MQSAVAGWLLCVMLALGLAGQQLRAGRRREALNRALHELRRPLQALVLAHPPSRTPGMAAGSLELAITALARLDAEVNGAAPPAEPGSARCRGLVEAGVARWRSRAAMAGGSIELRWRAPEHACVAAPSAVAQAIDNLLVNAIEHGGASIVVEAALRRGKIRIRVSDSGRASRGETRRETPRETIARLTGRRRRGHGLAVVRRIASMSGGRFAFQQAECGSTAILELPLAGGADARAA